MEKKRQMTAKDFALVEKYAKKFVYDNTESVEYDEYVSAGLEGLIKALDKFDETKAEGTTFETYATRCILNELATKQRYIKKFDLQQDENVVLEENETISETFQEEDITKSIEFFVNKANNGNKRNVEIFFLNIGYYGDEPMDYKELSKKFNMTAERCRQICANTRKALESKKSYLYSFTG